MAYEKTMWISGQTPLSATNMNHMEDGIEQINNLSNPNLLINSDFRNPINQRGQTSYTNAGWTSVYSIDRWKLICASATVNNGSVTFKDLSGEHCNCLWYHFEKTLSENTYTLTIKVKSLTGGVNVISTNLDKGLINGLNVITWNGSISNLYFNFSAKASIEIEYMKLEQGSIATPFVPRPYAEELALCQRYYIGKKYDCFPGYGFTNYLITQAVVTIPTPVEMRTTPTIILHNYGCLYGQGANETFVFDDIADTLLLPNGVQFRVNNLESFRKNESVTCAFISGFAFDAEIY